MALKLVSSLIFLFVLLFNNELVDCQSTRKLRNAIAVVRGKAGVIGTIKFKEDDQDKVNINGTITGLTKGPHALHVHQFGDLSQGCDSAGEHFSVHIAKNGHDINHPGDFGNFEANSDGIATIIINGSHVKLHGEDSIVGRAVLIHTGPDNTSTNRDSRPVGCGIIGWDD